MEEVRLQIYAITHSLQMTHHNFHTFTGSKMKGKFDIMPSKLKHFSRSSVTEKKSIHLMITLLALN